jgi:hypothetical protein
MRAHRAQTYALEPVRDMFLVVAVAPKKYFMQIAIWRGFQGKNA